MNPIILDRVTFAYDTQGEPVIRELSVTFHPGWTGVVGPNGVGKTTLLRLATGDLTPLSGVVSSSESALYCAQRTDDPPDEFLQFLSAPEAGKLWSILEIGHDWPYRWQTLSHGERKRAQVGTALWREPEVLALDEPTNHLDADTATMIVDALAGYTGIGLIVSHDRRLLDRLCSHCLFLSSGTPVMRPGGYTQGRAQEEAEGEFARKRHAEARRRRESIERERVHRREIAASQQRRRSKRGLALKDHDARFKRNLARITGKDGTGGKLLRQLDGTLAQAQKTEKEIELPGVRKTGVGMRSEAGKGDVLFRLGPEEIALGGDKILSIPEICMAPGQRVALTGANGSGKSTLIRRILSELDEFGERLVYIPQEISAEESAALVAEVRATTQERLGELMAYFSRLGSDPERLLETGLPSPGEARKLLLALGIVRIPQLIIMDEPTNHLDVVSVECLEEALGEVECGLLLVSHDMAFIEALTSIRWRIEQGSSGTRAVGVLMFDA